MQESSIKVGELVYCYNSYNCKVIYPRNQSHQKNIPFLQFKHFLFIFNFLFAFFCFHLRPAFFLIYFFYELLFISAPVVFKLAKLGGSAEAVVRTIGLRPILSPRSNPASQSPHLSCPSSISISLFPANLQKFLRLIFVAARVQSYFAVILHTGMDATVKIKCLPLSM